MATEFIPTNGLEQNLVDAQNGTIPLRSFVETLLRSQVVALFDAEVGSQDASTIAAPLVLSGSTGAPMLAMFTSLNRTQPITDSFPAYRFALLVDARWLLQQVADGVGLVVNPGWRVGLEMPPFGLSQLKAERLTS